MYHSSRFSASLKFYSVALLLIKKSYCKGIIQSIFYFLVKCKSAQVWIFLKNMKSHEIEMEYGNCMIFFAEKGLYYSVVFKLPAPGDKGRFSWNLTFLNIREFYIFFFNELYARARFFFEGLFFLHFAKVFFKKGLKKIMMHLKVKGWQLKSCPSYFSKKQCRVLIE